MFEWKSMKRFSTTNLFFRCFVIRRRMVVFVFAVAWIIVYKSALHYSQERTDQGYQGIPRICCKTRKYTCEELSCFEVCEQPETIDKPGTILKRQHFYQPEKLQAFLLETSGQSMLNPRQACSVESLAVHNPHLTIRIIMTQNHEAKQYELNSETPDFLQAIISKYQHVKREFVSMTSLLDSSPLASWYYCSNWTNSPYKVAHLSDGLRALTVWQHGGYYFDLDFIHIRPVTTYRNFMVLPDENNLGNSVFHAERGHPVFENVLKEFRESYRAEEWAYNGPLCFTRVLKKYCNVTNLADINFLNCNGFHVLPSSSFFPVHYNDYQKFFETRRKSHGNWIRRIDEYTVAFHTWNKLSSAVPLYKNSSQLYIKLAKLNCPITFAMAPNVF